jgi:aminocarboxymuconate-semialdehyde decarboxylase
MLRPMACACGIDIQAHVVPERYPHYLGRTVPSPWPETAAAPDATGLCHRHVMVNGRHDRTVSEKCWSPTRRLADLPEMGLAAQVVSPMPELLSYWLELADAQPPIRCLNELVYDAPTFGNARRIPGRAAPVLDKETA